LRPNLRGQLTAEQEKAYGEANTIFIGVVIGVHVDRLQEVYLCDNSGKDMWDALNTDSRGLDVGTELYIIEQYHD
jgi:hypothetical protein